MIITDQSVSQRKNKFSERRTEWPSQSPSVGTRPTPKGSARPRTDRPTPAGSSDPGVGSRRSRDYLHGPPLGQRGRPERLVGKSDP